MKRSLALGLLLCSGLPTPGSADEWNLVHTFRHQTGDQFGESLAMSDDGATVAIAAAMEDCAAGPDCGAVYVYDRGDRGWRKPTRLAASDQAAGAGFGGWEYRDRTIALSADGRTLAVSLRANWNGPGTGAVYVFERTDDVWHETQKLTIPDNLLPGPLGSEFNSFGASLALSGDAKTLVVGAPSEGLAEEQGGAVYVYRRQPDGWKSIARLVGSRLLATTGPNRFGALGQSVDITSDGRTIVAGSPGSPSDLRETYVFQWHDGSWVERDIIHSSNQVMAAGFGASVSLAGDGETLIVGAPGSASAYLYVLDAAGGDWRLQAKLGSNITNADRFGFSTAVDRRGKMALAGDWWIGSVFAFTRSDSGGVVTWPPVLVKKATSILGSSVALSPDGRTALLGWYVEPDPPCARSDGSSGPCAVTYLMQRRQASR
ncbi:MAG: hypothetical protein U1E83_00245 [Methylotetracoccus sp.]